MVHIIPLFVGERRLDTGNPVQYPDSSPVGEAVQQSDDEWQAVAGRYRQRMAQQQAFDTEIAARQLNGEIAKAEADAVANAPADGAGLHDAMYGQVDRRTGQVLQPGQFDTVFANFLKQVPPGLRAGLLALKPALREAGAWRMAARQHQRRDDYEQSEWRQAENEYTSAIAQSDHRDTANFEAIRQRGLDFIANIGSPLARHVAEAAWKSNAAKALVQAMIAQDPKRAAEMLGAAQAGDGMGETVWVEVGPPPQGNEAAAKGDRLGKLTPDERVSQAFGGDISPEQRPALLQQARMADATKQIEMRAGISLAEQNAPEAIRKTGTYSGPVPTEQQFLALYGPTEGGRRYQAINRTLEISHRYHDMLTMPNDAVRAMVTNSEPKPDSVTPAEDKARHEAIAAAADLTFKARQGDPGGYVREAFKNLDAAWNNISKPEDYQAAIIGSIVAQEQLGFETTQPLPNSVAGGVVDGLRNGTQSQDEDPTLSSIFAALPTRAAQEAMLGHLLQTSAAQAGKDIENRTRREAIVDPMGLLDLGNTVEPGRSGANAELTNYIPTLQEQFGKFIAGDSARGSLRRFLAQKLVGSDGLGEDGFSAADVTPVGAAFALDRAGAAALEGRYSDAVLEVGGIIPTGRLAAPVFKRAGKIAEPWVEKLSNRLKRSNELAREALFHGVDAETLRYQQELARSTFQPVPRPKREFDNAMLGAMLARDPAQFNHVRATVGWEASTNYRNTFFSRNSTLNAGDYVVHHAIEQRVFAKYPGLFTKEEINSIENLRGIRKEFDVNLHQKVIKGEWSDFYLSHPTATRQQIIDKASEIDRKYGHLFDPPIGE